MSEVCYKVRHFEFTLLFKTCKTTSINIEINLTHIMYGGLFILHLSSSLLRKKSTAKKFYLQIIFKVFMCISLLLC